MQSTDFSTEWNRGQPLVELIDGIAVVTKATVVHKADYATIRATVIFDPLLERFAVSEFSLSALPGREVTGSALRAIRMQDYLLEAADNMVFVRFEDNTWHQYFGLDDYLAETVEQADDHDYHAAKVYAIARLMNRPPLKEVAETMDVSQSTASRMIARARERGQFPNLSDSGVARKKLLILESNEASMHFGGTPIELTDYFVRFPSFEPMDDPRDSEHRHG